MARPRLRRLQTLRWRILTGTTAVLLVTFALVGVITVLALRTFLVHRLDQELEAAGTRFSVSLEHPADRDADNDPSQFTSVEGQAAGTLGARILDGKVTAAAIVQGRGDEAPTVSARARAVLGRLRAGNSVQEVELPELGHYRVLVTRGDDGDLLVTGLPEQRVRETTERLVVIEAIVFGVAIVAVALVNSGLIGFAARPLERVAKTAASVAALPMGSGAVRIDTRAPVPKARGGEAGQVAVALNGLLEEVDNALAQRQASEDRLRHFVADASHELRTPVAVIRAHAEYAQRAGADPRESLARIQAEADRVGRLVDDLLLLARLDSGRPLERAEVDLTRIVLESVSDARLTAPGHRWRLALPDAPVRIIGDDHALRQVVANLLTNVRTHTPPGTTASVRVEPGDPVVLTVRDDGPGLPPAIAGRIFDRFVRGDDECAAATSSSGLGLAIVAAIVEAHGGRAEAVPGEGGACLRIVLPAGGPPADDDAEPELDEDPVEEDTVDEAPEPGGPEGTAPDAPGRAAHQSAPRG